MTTPVQRVTRWLAATFLLAGVLGCLPGVTSHLDEATVTGPGSAAVLLGVLPVTVAGNVLHLTAAAVGSVAVRSALGARRYLLWAGPVYAVLCLRSVVIGTADASPADAAVGGLWVAAGGGVVVLALGLLATDAGALRPVRGWVNPSGAG